MACFSYPGPDNERNTRKALCPIGAPCETVPPNAAAAVRGLVTASGVREPIHTPALQGRDDRWRWRMI